jgi:TonB family protein
MVTHFVFEHTPPPVLAPPAPPPPQLRPAQIEIPPSDLSLNAPSDGALISTAAPSEPGPTTPVAGLRAVHREQGGPAARFPSTADYYPPTSRRMGESGAATIEICADAAGRLTADPTLAASSGSVRLDSAALRLAKAGSGHYRPTREDGRPVSACYPFRVRFALEE